MSTIQIHDLAPAGLHLFSDAETYLTELGPETMIPQQINGGSTPCCVAAATYLMAAGFGAHMGIVIGNEILADTT